MALERRNTFGPVGCCIYCLRKDVPLSLEHIIPYGLMGKVELEKASCAACATVTGAVEQYVLRDLLGHFRIRSGMKTRRPKLRPKVLPATIIEDGQERKIELPVNEHHASTMIIALPSSRIISGETGPLSFKLNHYSWRMENPPAKFFKVSIRIDVHKFARMLAKIAHSHCIRILGLDGFNPLLPNIILNEDADPFEYVGGEIDLSPPYPQNVHLLRIYSKQINGIDYVCVYARLFANFKLGGDNGFPIYHVICGTSNNLTGQRLSSGPFYPRIR